MMLSRYRKTIAAVVGAAITWASAVVISDPAAITSAEWVAGALALATALGIYAIPNDAPHGAADPDISERG